jgi:AraC-like DNA-binding protein
MAAVKNTFFRYLPISLMDKQWGVYVPTAGYSWTEAHAPSYPLTQHPSAYHFIWEQGRILQEFQVLYIIRGEGVFESALSGQRPIKAGNAFMLFPGVWHRYAPNPETGWDEYWVGFDGDLPRRLVAQRVFVPQKPVFAPGLDETWHELFTRAIETIKLEPLGYQQTLAALAFEILTRLHALGRAQQLGGDADHAIIRKAKCLLTEHLEQTIDWESLAKDLHVSYSWLRHTFRQHTGFSPHQYQLQLRINKAENLLNNTACSIKEIAAQLGFECPYHFSHLFKRKTGLAPETWRHNARGGNWKKPE